MFHCTDSKVFDRKCSLFRQIILWKRSSVFLYNEHDSLNLFEVPEIPENLHFRHRNLFFTCSHLSKTFQFGGSCFRCREQMFLSGKTMAPPNPPPPPIFLPHGSNKFCQEFTTPIPRPQFVGTSKCAQVSHIVSGKFVEKWGGADQSVLLQHWFPRLPISC